MGLACKTLCLVAGACLALLPAAAHAARSGELGVPGMPERQLRAFETEVLGPSHAREHAGARRGASETGGEPAPALSAARTEAADLPGLTAAGDDGQWGTPFSIPVMAIHSALLPTGKVLWFAYPTNPNPSQGAGPGVPNEAMAWLWDPAAGTGPSAFKRVDPPVDPRTGKPANIWCAGQMLLSDGRVLVTGGNMRYPDPSAPPGQTDFKGLDKVYTFNPYNETWAEQPDMQHGRWYPSQVLLPDGRAAILDGYDETGGGSASRNAQIEVFTPSPDPDGAGTLELVSTRNDADQPPFIGGGIYPHLAVLPTGRTLVFGPYEDDAWWFDLDGGFDWDWTSNPPDKHLWGTGVLIPEGTPSSPSERVMLIGGSDPDFTNLQADSYLAHGDVRTLDTSPDFEPWVDAPSLNVARAHHNTVLLPDGSMVTVGGGVGKDTSQNQWAATEPQKQVELWDPVTGNWSLGAAQAESRAYHSTALLLPDGRVVSAGDDFNGGISQDTAEIYEPPYLHTGNPRPVLKSVPPSAILDQNFTVRTDDAVTKAVLLAPGATTHANDMHQRFVPLEIAADPAGDALTLRAPLNANVAPPGYYMLFLLSGDGVPSVAKFLRIDAAADTTAPKTYLFDGPSGGTTSRTATFRFGGSELGAGFMCRLDGGAWGGCSSPVSFAGVGDGTHTFEVAASDGVNDDPTPAARSWSVDGTAPETSIGSTPPAATSATSASFAFDASEGGSSFACSIDGGPFGACASPATYAGLGDGAHSFAVRATDQLGNADGSPAGYSWRIDRTAPGGSFRPARRQRLRLALERGVRGTIACDEACSITADLLVDGRVLRRPRASRLVRVARRSASLASPGRAGVVLRPDRRSRALLARQRRVTFTLRATIADSLGNRRAVTATLRLR